MVWGRPPRGAGHVDGLDGPEGSKERLRAFLRAMLGEQTVQEACRELGIGESRFHALRREALQGALDALGPRPAGRPAREESPEASRIQDLEAQVADLQEEILCQRVRLELALTMPHVLKVPGARVSFDQKGETKSGPRRMKGRGQRG